MNFATLFVAAFAPLIVQTPAGPFDARRRYWPPHRPVGTPKRKRLGGRRKLVGAKGLR